MTCLFFFFASLFPLITPFHPPQFIFLSEELISSIVGCLGAPAANVAGAIGAPASDLASIVTTVEERANAA